MNLGHWAPGLYNATAADCSVHDLAAKALRARLETNCHALDAAKRSSILHRVGRAGSRRKRSLRVHRHLATAPRCASASPFDVPCSAVGAGRLAEEVGDGGLGPSAGVGEAGVAGRGPATVGLGAAGRREGERRCLRGDGQRGL